MSIRRIGTPTVVVGLGVLASLALMAAPSRAAEGGNSANAKLCQPGGYPGALLAQDGSAFKNVGECTSYAAKGGQLVGVDAVAGPVVEGPEGPHFRETCTGFGLKPTGTAPPFTEGSCGAKYESRLVGILAGRAFVVAADGTFSVSLDVPCEKEESRIFGVRIKITSLEVAGRTAEGTVIGPEFPSPSGC